MALKIEGLFIALVGMGGSLLFANSASAACIPVCVTVHGPTVTVTPPNNNPVSATITPLGPLPSSVGQPVNQAARTGVKAAVAPSIAVVNIIAGKETLGEAGANIAAAHGAHLQAIGEAVSQMNAQNQNLKIIAATKIGGNVGKTVMTLGTGPDRLAVEFAATLAIEAGGILQGMPLDRVIAAPLAAAIRSAVKEFLPRSQPIPVNIRQAFLNQYSSVVLDNARFAIGSISISVPDVTNMVVKKFQGNDNAVTVGNITVFSVAPGMNLHWWAHELQHQVQYQNWGIDEFAYKYVTSCHGVESDAEDKARAVAPISGNVHLSC
jgi:hypothetical protein